MGWGGGWASPNSIYCIPHKRDNGTPHFYGRWGSFSESKHLFSSLSSDKAPRSQTWDRKLRKPRPFLGTPAISSVEVGKSQSGTLPTWLLLTPLQTGRCAIVDLVVRMEIPHRFTQQVEVKRSATTTMLDLSFRKSTLHSYCPSQTPRIFTKGPADWFHSSGGGGVKPRRCRQDANSPSSWPLSLPPPSTRCALKGPTTWPQRLRCIFPTFCGYGQFL